VCWEARGRLTHCQHNLVQFIRWSSRPKFSVLSGAGVAGVDVLISSKRSQTFCPAVFELHGIDIATKRCIGLKSVAHFRAGFTDGERGNVSRIITADAMGLTTKRPGVFEHHRATQAMWPNHADAAPASEVEELAEAVARL
jgi:microcystin degradation protein MlrC